MTYYQCSETVSRSSQARARVFEAITALVDSNGIIIILIYEFHRDASLEQNLGPLMMGTNYLSSSYNYFLTTSTEK